ncbi:MAG TPA: hypothetical protein VN249_06790, partial [Prolixibacteraceae bacterium]|nr:hypothetical protein [Prolixibacteraceae bacterium]
ILAAKFLKFVQQLKTNSARHTAAVDAAAAVAAAVEQAAVAAAIPVAAIPKPHQAVVEAAADAINCVSRKK